MRIKLDSHALEFIVMIVLITLLRDDVFMYQIQ